MHALLYVLCPKDDVNTSNDAKNIVYNWLIEEHFVGEDGYFASPIADWLVIGGRWSGELTRIKLNQKKLKALNDEFDKKYGWWINKDNSEKQRLQQN